VKSVVVGPGIGDRDETDRAVKRLVEAARDSKLPLVIDADAIEPFAGELKSVRGSDAVLTPNAGEFKTIAGVEVKEDWKERIEPCVDLAKEAGCTVLLKGDHSVITDGERLKINSTGNPAMATGGTGDVLSGVIGAYLAQGAETFWASVAGAYAHGRAGDLASQEKGYHVLASDIIEELPAVLKPFDR
jgi:NAD(P)H-hydrate epimerase